ncbi:MAG: hypothetical protein ACR652_01290 [Methylocystis sp.]|uniref:hypothetical protein n=1 Tax=Methylocystis sp. TaxID=1911079 RepID=UPI003DA24002
MSDKKRARAMLASVIPFSNWRNGETTTRAQIWLRTVREIIKLSDLTPDEHKRESDRLELDAAVAFVEGSKS